MNVHPVAGAIVSNTNDDDLIHRITTRGISIAQFIIGSLSLILGIVIVILGVRPSIGLGIWGGIWIVVTGIIGIVLSSNSNNGCCFTGTYLAFSIVSTIVASINIILLSILIAVSGHCRMSVSDSWMQDGWKCFINMSRTHGLYIPLLLLMIVEFFTSIVASAYSCKRSTCCVQQQPAIVITQTQQPGQMLTTRSPQFVTIMATPGQTYSGQVISQPHGQPVY